jgi:ribosomal-protein-alanine acetyltransferase
MRALEKHAVTAAHWSREQYEQIFVGPEHADDCGAASGTPAPSTFPSASFGASARRAGSQAPGRRRYEGTRRVALVIEEESRVQGFLVAHGLDKEWEIENIAISGAARRRGLGARLLGEFLDQARGQRAEAVFLEVRESNQAARALYEKWAFEESGRRAQYYREPEEDAIVYRLCFP